MPDTDVLAGLVLQQLTAVRCGEDEGAVQGRLLHSLHQPQLPPAWPAPGCRLLPRPQVGLLGNEDVRQEEISLCHGGLYVVIEGVLAKNLLQILTRSETGEGWHSDWPPAWRGGLPPPQGSVPPWRRSWRVCGRLSVRRAPACPAPDSGRSTPPERWPGRAAGERVCPCGPSGGTCWRCSSAQGSLRTASCRRSVQSCPCWPQAEGRTPWGRHTWSCSGPSSWSQLNRDES